MYGESINLQHMWQSKPQKSCLHESVGPHYPTQGCRTLHKLSGIIGHLFTFIPLKERFFRNDRKLLVNLGSALSTKMSKLDSWQVKSQSDLEACEALQTSLMVRCWSMFCAKSEGRHGRRSRKLAGEHILVMIMGVHRTVRYNHTDVIWRT